MNKEKTIQDYQEENEFLCQRLGMPFPLEYIPLRHRKICCLCGSSKYKDEFMELAARLTVEGKIVVMPHIFCHSDKIEILQNTKERLDFLHRSKIELSDEVHIVHAEYIGDSTKEEIRYAEKWHRPIIRHYAGEYPINFNG